MRLFEKVIIAVVKVCEHLVAAFWGVLAAAGVWFLFAIYHFLTKCYTVIEVDGRAIDYCPHPAYPAHVYIIVAIISLLAAVWYYWKYAPE